MKKIKTLPLIFSVLIVSLAATYLVSAWTEPDATPPGGNVNAPLNASINAQAKEGALIVGANEAVEVGLEIQHGKVGLGVTEPKSKLDIAGEVKLSSSGDACSSANEGALRYLNSDQCLYLCNGTNWTVLNCVGGKVTFTYRGEQVTYGTVEGQNGTIWLDRNLGALRVATTYNDSAASGDLFQWGRLDDGHQSRNSSTTSTTSSSDVPGHSNFITTTSSPRDWREPGNRNLWQGVDGINNPCPDGFRIPTRDEWSDEQTGWGIDGYNGAFNSSLKLPLTNDRQTTGYLDDDYSNAYYWSSTTSSTKTHSLYFNEDSSSFYDYYRAYGYAVRCILD